MNQDDKMMSVEQDQAAYPTQARNAKKDPQQSRRRLLKAAAVAPVIYTLPNGSALAAVSTCLRNEENTIGVTEVLPCDSSTSSGPGNSNPSQSAIANSPVHQGTESECDNPPLNTSQGTFTYAGSSNTTGQPFYGIDGSSNNYVYDSQNQQLWTESCWNSVNVASTGSTKAFQNIV